MGLTDAMMPGSSIILERPSKASVANQTSMIGPNTLPTVPVPRFCTINNPSRITIAMGITQELNAGETSSSPSTALNTEMAGVMIPSPYKSAVPKMPSATRRPALAAIGPRRGMTSAVRARMPPSPLLSARITKSRYFTEMMMTKAQNASEQIPYTLMRSTVMTCDFSVNASLSAYNGLVPMSP